LVTILGSFGHDMIGDDRWKEVSEFRKFILAIYADMGESTTICEKKIISNLKKKNNLNLNSL
jgi:hypothetical protein